MDKLLTKTFVKTLALHQLIYERSGGRLGHRVPRMPPSLLLRCTGRRTGQPRTSALTYASDGDRYLITASNGGARKAPAWLHNVTANPQCEIQVGRDRIPVTARPVYPADEGHARLWEIVNEVNNDRYRAYQRKTDREIPVVVLSPSG
ncbi:deazaflavin-dependent oxidoreductase, nitroreductase family [Haloechinothrix alba]|uniref:Deazaflavin-dependent oxidoreductase, nitroreductase family n=1 Tax=Haloechinothrix alba TaxID=664784 RepID=A0A238XH63_9PSEU|nr:nitroreductase family deazaflavin-dependent oxidoreductase [Haloechinothrix alba]SNR57259.1 deazaflavin-dependent oxidoreductase, nitroreductase family [Haloechinothrix alba]